MPTQPGPYGVRNVVSIRASRLSAAGARICPNPDGSAWMPGCVVDLGVTRTVDAGTTDVARDGDGNICQTRTTADAVTGIELSMNLLLLDFEMIEILTGALLLATAGPNNYGFEEPNPTDTPPNVEFHFWNRAWDGAGQAAAPYSYVHNVAFLTTWRLGDETFGEGATNIPLLGKGQANNSIVKGSFDDIPVDAQGDGFTARWLDTDLPDAGSAPYSTAPDGGWLDTPACTAS